MCYRKIHYKFCQALLAGGKPEAHTCHCFWFLPLDFLSCIKKKLKKKKIWFGFVYYFIFLLLKKIKFIYFIPGKDIWQIVRNSCQKTIYGYWVAAWMATFLASGNITFETPIITSLIWAWFRYIICLQWGCGIACASDLSSS